jgi:CRP/FNR family transcriptional regulator
MKRVKALLASVPVLSCLSETEQQDLIQLVVGKSYQKSEFIAHYGELWPYVCILESGAISIVKLSSDGRTLGARRMISGEVFWSPTLIDGNPLPASLEVKDACDVYLWHHDDVIPIIQRNPEALWALCQVLMASIRQASDFVEELIFHPVAGRLARLMLDIFEDKPDVRIARDMTLDEMGTMIGTTPVMVCKLLSRFASDGLINVSRTAFELIERDKLEEIAGFSQQKGEQAVPQEIAERNEA